MSTESNDNASWYDTKTGKMFYWGILGATLLAVGLSTTLNTALSIPPAMYLFGFLGATVYAFTSFAGRFDEEDRYRLKILSRTAAVLPLATGVYLLAFAFVGGSGDGSALGTTSGDLTSTDRVVAGLIFLAGIYVSVTLRALGNLAERLLGVSGNAENGTDDRADG